MGLKRDWDRDSLFSCDDRVASHDKDTMTVFYPFQGFIKKHLDPLQERLFREISILEEFKNGDTEYFPKEY
jgi:hypothetical protein